MHDTNTMVSLMESLAYGIQVIHVTHLERNNRITVAAGKQRRSGRAGYKDFTSQPPCFFYTGSLFVCQSRFKDDVFNVTVCQFTDYLPCYMGYTAVGEKADTVSLLHLVLFIWHIIHPFYKKIWDLSRN